MTGSLVVRALAAVVAASACTPAHSPHERDTCLHYEPEDALTSHEAAALEDAARAWRDSGVCVVRGPHDVRVRRMASAESGPDKFREYLRGNVIAFWSRADRTIWLVADRVDEEHTMPVFVHELGHAAGAQHTSTITDCMLGAVTSWCAMGGHVSNADVAAVSPQYRFSH